LDFPSPIFFTDDLGRRERSLGDFLSGKRAAVVMFWSSVCSHCLRYDDYLNSFAVRHPEVGLVAVASRQGENRDQIRASAA
jgi:hypothetical protein